MSHVRYFLSSQRTCPVLSFFSKNMSHVRCMSAGMVVPKLSSSRQTWPPSQQTSPVQPPLSSYTRLVSPTWQLFSSSYFLLLSHVVDSWGQVQLLYFLLPLQLRAPLSSCTMPSNTSTIHSLQADVSEIPPFEEHLETHLWATTIYNSCHVWYCFIVKVMQVSVP